MNSVRRVDRPLQIYKVEGVSRPRNPVLARFVRENIIPFLSQLGENPESKIETARRLDEQLAELGVQRTCGKGMVESFISIVIEVSRGNQEKMRQIMYATARFEPVLRELIEQSGVYFSHGFAHPFIHLTGELVGNADISYLGFRNRVYLVRPTESVRRVATALNIIAFFIGNQPDFLNGSPEEGDNILTLARELAQRAASREYFAGSEDILELERLGIDPHIFASYVIHEKRHVFDRGEVEGVEFSLSNGKVVGSIFELGSPKIGKRCLPIDVFEEATAYLAMIVDGPNPYFPIGRMFTLITNRPEHYVHRDGAITALALLCMELRISPELINPKDQEKLFVAMEQIASVDSEVLRTAADITLCRLYEMFYGIVDSNTF